MCICLIVLFRNTNSRDVKQSNVLSKNSSSVALFPDKSFLYIPSDSVESGEISLTVMYFN